MTEITVTDAFQLGFWFMAGVYVCRWLVKGVVMVVAFSFLKKRK